MVEAKRARKRNYFQRGIVATNMASFDFRPGLLDPHYLSPLLASFYVPSY